MWPGAGSAPRSLPRGGRGLGFRAWVTLRYAPRGACGGSVWYHPAMTHRTSSTAPFLAFVAILLAACTGSPSPSLDEVRAATSRYQSVDAALADGYTRDPLDVCETAYYLGEFQDLGAIGVHFFRRDLL